jgi:hypothetical protein
VVEGFTGGLMGSFITLSHPFKSSDNKTDNRQKGKEPPSLGSGGPSLTAVGVTLEGTGEEQMKHLGSWGGADERTE